MAERVEEVDDHLGGLPGCGVEAVERLLGVADLEGLDFLRGCCAAGVFERDDARVLSPEPRTIIFGSGFSSGEPVTVSSKMVVGVSGMFLLTVAVALFTWLKT